MRSVTPYFVNQNFGKVITVSSINATFGVEKETTYSIAKAAILQLTRSLATEVRKHGINVNCIVPGWIATDRQKKLWLTPKNKKETLERQCLKKMLKPDDIAKPVLFLASDQSIGISAQNYVVDGGIV